MKTISIQLSEQEFEKYGLDSSSIDFDQLLDKIKNVITKEAIIKCQEAASRTSLDTLTLDEINAEISAVRNG